MTPSGARRPGRLGVRAFLWLQGPLGTQSALTQLLPPVCQVQGDAQRDAEVNQTPSPPWGAWQALGRMWTGPWLQATGGRLGQRAGGRSE